MDSSSDSGSDSSHLLNPGTEKEYAFHQPRSTGFVARNRRPLIWSSITAILGVIAVVITYIAATARSTGNGFVSGISTGTVEFIPDDRFVQSWGPHSPWDELIPMGKGFVRVPPNQQQGLGETRALKDGSGEYCLSVFHQLHCLAMLRNTINNLRAGKPEIAHTHHIEQGQDPLGHADHCVDYLRQAIMCSGDMTLEHYAWTENGTVGPGVNGYFVNHQCKSWDHIMDFAKEHRSRDVQGVV